MTDNETNQSETSRVRDSYVTSGRVPLGYAIGRGLRDLFLGPLWGSIKFMPGAVGMKLRQWVYRMRLAEMGRHSLVEVGVSIPVGRNVRLGDFTLIDKYCQLTAAEGSIVIGSRCHLAPFTIILGHGGVTIEDYVGVAAGARIYSISEWPGEGKRLAGPMIPFEHRGLRKGPVVLKKDCFIGANAVILPGVTVGEGAVVGANTVVARDVEPWTVVIGNPAMPAGTREPVSVPDLSNVK